MKKFSLAAAVFGLVSRSRRRIRAVRIGDDGFDTGCCTLPAPFLPSFPPLTMLGQLGRAPRLRSDRT